MLILVRVWLPDRPGALGQVASRIGAVRGDVLGIEILEVGGGRVIDELVVKLDDPSLVDLLITEVGAVDGVSVEHVRPIADDRTDPDLNALQLGAALADCPIDQQLTVLCHGMAAVADAAWSVVVHDSRVIASVGTPPDSAWLFAFLEGSTHLVPGHTVGVSGDTGPSDLLWARLPRHGVALAAGRSDRPVHERERIRFHLLSKVIDALLDPTAIVATDLNPAV
jgi:hypothetical protein